LLLPQEASFLLKHEAVLPFFNLKLYL
jgi:hypothetical protein